MIEQWAPTIICCGAFSIIWFDIRSHKKKTDVKIKELLPEEKHILLCKNASLEIKAHITEENKAMKEEILEAINGGR